MFEVVIQCVEMFDDAIRKMAAEEALFRTLFRIHDDDYRLQCQYHHRMVPPTIKGFARRNYWLRIRSNPMRKNYH